MEFQLSDLQRELVEGVERYLRDAATPEAARASLDREPHGYDRELWRGLASLGVTGLSIGEAYGGMGLGDLELGFVAECAGRFLVRAPLGSTIWRSAAAIELLGSEAQKEWWLPKIAAGDIAVAYVDVAAHAFAEPDVAGGRLTARFPVVADAMAADLFVVVAPGGAWLIEAEDEGVARTALETFDLLQPSADVVLTGATAEPMGAAAEPMGAAAEPMGERDVRDAIRFLRQRAAVLTAFEQVGMCQAAIDGAVAYAKERYAFGRAIGSFQAVKHLLADMYVKMEIARSNSYYAGWALATRDANLTAAAAAAHLSATDALRHCAANAIQVHGGIGFTWELDCHLRYRRAHHLALQSGPARLWQDDLIDALARQREAA